MELYLEESKVDRSTKLDVLTFWKANQFRYPELASMAWDILSIPVSTVASESTFSVGGRVIDQFRSALKLDIVKALVCTRDWLYGEKGNLVYIFSYFIFNSYFFHMFSLIFSLMPIAIIVSIFDIDVTQMK